MLKRHMMTAAGAVALGLGVSSASAQSFNVSCVKGQDERRIEIVSPGAVGKRCDVRYTTGGSDVRTPYHANNSADFCQTKAAELVSELITDGYACGQAGGPVTVESRAPETPEESAPVEAAQEDAAAAAPVPAGQTTNLTPAPAVQDAIAAAETAALAAETVADQAEQIVEPALTQTAATPPAPASVVEAAPATATAAQTFEPQSAPAVAETATQTAVETASLPAIAETVATAPEKIAADADLAATTTAQTAAPSAPAAATRGPATLAGTGLEDVNARTRPTPAGRIVGAAPETAPAKVIQEQPPQTALSPTPAAAVVAAPAAPEATTRSAPAVKPDTKPNAREGFRSPAEVIRATLAAQAAAWNEGNLPAFMETYWKNDKLKFVSGTEISKGWSATMKRYRNRYADASGLGQLGFEKMDVQMVTDDVAVVTGRFNHVKNEDASSGVFTLVMRQTNGVWRIVHDHTAADEPQN
ncbi:MAG: nuclear transport factor 2 family protein [Pseudomonadota bacterium]